MSSMSSESKEDDIFNIIDSSNEDDSDSNSEVETERFRTRSRSPNKRPIDKSRSNEITPVDVVIADIEGGLNTIDQKLQN